MVSREHIKCLPQKLSNSELFFCWDFFVVVFIDLFVWLLLVGWGFFVCFFISLFLNTLSLTCNSVSVVLRETWELIPFVTLLLSLKEA